MITTSSPVPSSNLGGAKESAPVVRLRPPWATSALLGLVVVYFAMSWIAGGAEDIAVALAFGANYGPLVAEGDLWRLMTSIFLHGGILHLVLNAYALYFLGRNLEAFYGPWNLLVIFLGAGMGGSAASAGFSQNISVGASGGIFGLVGASLVFAFRYRKVLPSRVTVIMGTALVPWVILNLVAGVFIPVLDSNAHFGGLIAGALLGVALRAEAIDEAHGRVLRRGPSLAASFLLAFLVVSFGSSVRNIFAMRGESGAMLDPRVASNLPGSDQEKLLSDINAAIAKDPKNVSLLSMRAQLHGVQGDWFEAIRDYQGILDLAPEDATVMNNLAWVLLEEAPEELRNRSEAERLASRAIEIEPDNAYALGTYGTALLRRGAPQEAVGYLTKAVSRRRPRVDTATDRYILAIALSRVGKFDEAEKALEKARREDPDNRYRVEAEEAVDRIQAPSGSDL